MHVKSTLTGNVLYYNCIAGFRSQVQFLSVIDPTRTCNYISEVLDGGPLGPVFKVCFLVLVHAITAACQFRLEAY